MIKQQRVCQKTVNAGQALDMPVGFRFTERAQSSPTHGLSMRVMVRSEDLGLQVLKGASPPRGLDLQAHGWSHQFGPEGRHLGAVLSGAMRLARAGPEPHTMLGSHSSMFHGGCQPDVGNNSKVFVSILVECWEVILVRGPGSLMHRASCFHISCSRYSASASHQASFMHIAYVTHIACNKPHSSEMQPGSPDYVQHLLAQAE